MPSGKSEQISDNVAIKMILDRMDRTDDLIEKVAESQSDTNVKFASFLEKYSHTEDRADKQEEALSELEERTDHLEKSNIRFIAYIVSGFVIISSLISVGAWWYVQVHKPQQTNMLTNKSAIESIEHLNETNEAILELLKPESQP